MRKPPKRPQARKRRPVLRNLNEDDEPVFDEREVEIGGGPQEKPVTSDK